eukprot:9497148-Pyramimonas_sp.AAC.1
MGMYRPWRTRANGTTANTECDVSECGICGAAAGQARPALLHGQVLPEGRLQEVGDVVRAFRGAVPSVPHVQRRVLPRAAEELPH